MYRSILLPLDGSRFGEHALQLATSLAHRCGARLQLVHVHNTNADNVKWEPVTPFRFLGLERSEREWDGEEISAEQQYLARQATELANELSLATTYKILTGPVVSALEHEIEVSDPDLLVMATHGRGGFSRAWLGSVADSLMRRVHKPLLVVRTENEGAPLTEPKTRNVLIALDGSALSESIVAHALELGQGAATDYTLLRVVPPVWSSPEIMSEPDVISEGALKERLREAREYLLGVASRMTGVAVTVTCEVVVGTAAAGTILEYARNRDMDIVAMATHGRGGVKRLVLGSVADKVVRASHVPVLLYHPLV